MKTKLVIFSLLALYMGYLNFTINYKENKINSLQGEKNSLIIDNNNLSSELKRRNEYVVKLSQEKKELEEASKKDIFDWNVNISDSNVIKLLQEQHNSHK